MHPGSAMWATLIVVISPTRSNHTQLSSYSSWLRFVRSVIGRFDRGGDGSFCAFVPRHCWLGSLEPEPCLPLWGACRCGFLPFLLCARCLPARMVVPRQSWLRSLLVPCPACPSWVRGACIPVAGPSQMLAKVLVCAAPHHSLLGPAPCLQVGGPSTVPQPQREG